MTPETGNPGRRGDGGVFITRGPEETRVLGALLAENLSPGDFISLDGELASGKTCLVQGLAAGLGYRDPVTSPTFALLHLYEGGRLPLYHFDVYRLESPEELENIGYEDYFYGDGVCVVEWGGLTADYLPERRIGLTLERIELERIENEGWEARRIIVTPYGGDEPRMRDIIVRIERDFDKRRRSPQEAGTQTC